MSNFESQKYIGQDFHNLSTVKLDEIREIATNDLRRDDISGSYRNEANAVLRDVLRHLADRGWGEKAVIAPPELPRVSSNLVGNVEALKAEIASKIEFLQNKGATPPTYYRHDPEESQQELVALWGELAKAEKQQRAEIFGQPVKESGGLPHIPTFAERKQKYFDEITLHKGDS